VNVGVNAANNKRRLWALRVWRRGRGCARRVVFQFF
jgi:hypothetical protein